MVPLEVERYHWVGLPDFPGNSLASRTSAIILHEGHTRGLSLSWATDTSTEGQGLSLREIGPQVGCSHQGVALIVRRAARRPVRADGWVPGPGRLTLDGREEITLGLRAGESFTAIAARLGKAVSAVSREVAANGSWEGYRARRAHQRARQQARRPKTPKLARPELAAQVTSWLHEWWSPVQISRRLRIEFPGDP